MNSNTILRNLILCALGLGVSQLTGCGNKETDTGNTTINVDADGDGQTTAEGDCDDNNPNVNSNATEFCDEIDNNCD